MQATEDRIERPPDSPEPQSVAATLVSSADRRRWFSAAPLQRLRRVVQPLLLELRLSSLRLYPRSWLSRVGREHHMEPVRRRAWVLNGAFVVGEGCQFSWHVSAVVEHWGQVAARLGERVGLAPGVTFIAASGHRRSHRMCEFEAFSDRHVVYAPIEVGDDTWIGTGAILLPGVRLGKLCVVGAGAVVTKDVADYSVVAGVPARVIGDIRHRGRRDDPSLST